MGSDQRIVLVTGASSGIGRAAAIKIAGSGATVVVAARRPSGCAATVDTILANGGNARFLELDISKTESVDSLFQQIDGDYGRLDASFNNAGIEGLSASIADTPVASYDEVFATNVRGTFLCMQAELRIMVRQGFGAIVNTASIGGVVALPKSPVYTASKHAIIGLTKSASLDYAAQGIRVNCVCPGSVRSEMSDRWFENVPGGEGLLRETIPMRRIGEAVELANAAAWLLSEEASYVTGATLMVDGGYTVP